MSIIQFDIGDWSKDGHGISDSFNIISNLDVTVLRAAHLKFKDLYGINIGSICCDSSRIKESLYTTLYLLDILDKNKYPSPAEINWKSILYKFGYYVSEPKDILERMVHSSMTSSDTTINCPGYGLYD